MRITTRGKVVGVLGLLVLLALALALPAYLYLRSIGLAGQSDPGARVDVTVPSGASAGAVGDLLEDAGVVPSALGFRLAVYFRGGDEDIQAGRYELRRGLSAGDALDALRRGPVVEFVTVTFPEGSSLEDFARILDAETQISGARFLELASEARVGSKYLPSGVDTLEGLLFPSTYQIVEREDARAVLVRLVREFERQVGRLDLTRAERLGVSPYEAIIVASLVEAEAKVDDDRARIARVIYNRLSDGMPLGIDATVNYALREQKLDLTRSELAVDSPYNTRQRTGLPPTPIGAPGLDSLRAALDPAPGEWRYFVLADCEGRHAFSETYRDFLRNKARYRSLEC